MATEGTKKFTGLPSDILSAIGKLISFSDRARLRSSCKYFSRRLAPPPPTFPLKVPDPPTRHLLEYVPYTVPGHFAVNCTSVYRVHPLEDASDGCVMRLSQRKNGTYWLLSPFLENHVPIKFGPVELTYADFEAIEIGKGYFMSFVADEAEDFCIDRQVFKKLIVAVNANFDRFVVGLLCYDGGLIYLRASDDRMSWIHCKMEDYDLVDFIFDEDKRIFYGIDHSGVLVTFGFDFMLRRVDCVPVNVPAYLAYKDLRLVKYKEQLYVFCSLGKEIHADAFDSDDSDDDQYGDGTINLQAKLYKWITGLNWMECKSIDEEILVLFQDFQFGISPSEVSSSLSEGNQIALAHRAFRQYETGYVLGNAGCLYLRESFVHMALPMRNLEQWKMFYPFPCWLKKHIVSLHKKHRAEFLKKKQQQEVKEEEEKKKKTEEEEKKKKKTEEEEVGCVKSVI